MNYRRPHSTDEGMVLVNVLAVIALTSAVVMLMISSQELTLARTRRLREASQADSYVRAGELSASTALRRDMIEAPQTDDATEPWGKISQADVEIAGGRFELSLRDAQDRFNINNLRQGGIAAQSLIGKLFAKCDVALEPRAIAAYIQIAGPLTSEVQLRSVGVQERQLVCLRPMLTALPSLTSVNLNSATDETIDVLFDDRVTAALLIAQRKRQGRLTEADMNAAKVIVPLGAGFTSDWFVADTSVTVGDTTSAWSSLLHRTRKDGRPAVVAVRREKMAAKPITVPPPL